MTTALHATPDIADLSAAAALQKIVPELVALALDAKQAHWNVTGDAFVAVHALTDEIAADARAWADRVAERTVALGFSVDARPATIAGSASTFPAGRIAARDAVSELRAAVDRAATATHAALNTLDRSDPVSHDIAVAVLEGLDKYRWMLDAQAA
jgi:starvation-inducible DNA-binding protein